MTMMGSVSFGLDEFFLAPANGARDAAAAPTAPRLGRTEANIKQCLGERV